VVLQGKLLDSKSVYTRKAAQEGITYASICVMLVDEDGVWDWGGVCLRTNEDVKGK